MSLSILIDWKDNSYDLILIIIDYVIKMVYYTLVKIRINGAGFAKMIINVVIKYHNLLMSIISD